MPAQSTSASTGIEAIYRLVDALQGLAEAPAAESLRSYDKVERAAVAVNLSSLTALDDVAFTQAARESHFAFHQHARDIRRHLLYVKEASHSAILPDPLYGKEACRLVAVAISRILIDYARASGVFIGGRSQYSS